MSCFKQTTLFFGIFMLTMSLYASSFSHAEDERNRIMKVGATARRKALVITRKPTKKPSRKPTRKPSRKPTRKPSRKPTRKPSRKPTRKPSRKPTRKPSRKPTRKPSRKPTRKITANPTRKLSKPTRRPIAPTRSPTSSAANVVDAIRRDITFNMTLSPPLAAKFVRLGFHDCVGGCDGCVDMTNQDNAGLDIPIDALAPIVQKYQGLYGITRADIWAISALTAAEFSAKGSYTFPVTWIGRVNCEARQVPCLDQNNLSVPCNATRGPHRILPSPDLTTSQVLHYFSQTFSFNTQETVAIMGAHSIGTASRKNSGFNGTAGWVGNNRLLDNAYYKELVGGISPNDTFANLFDGPRWNQRRVDNSDIPSVPNRIQWEHPKSPSANSTDAQVPPTIMLNADISLVRDMTGKLDATTGAVSCLFTCNNCGPNPPACPYAQLTFNTAVEYKFNNTKWLSVFGLAFNKMLTSGYNTSGGCSRIPCKLP